MNQPEASPSNNADAGRGLSEGLGPDPERAAFERWMSNDGKWPAAVERSIGGGYRLGVSEHAWSVWQAAVAAERERWESKAREMAVNFRRNGLEAEADGLESLAPAVRGSWA